MKKLAKEVFEAYRPFRRPMLTVFALIAVSRAVDLVNPYFQGLLIDGLVNGKTAKYVFALLVSIFALSLFEAAVIKYRREMYEIKKIDLPIPDHLRNFVLERLLRFSIGQHLRENSGIRLSVAHRGEQALQRFIMEALYNLTPTAIEVCLLSGILLYFSPVLGMIVVVGVSIYLGIVITVQRNFSGELDRLENMRHRDNKFFGEILRNVRLVLSQAQEKRIVHEHDEMTSETRGFNEAISLRFQRWVMVRDVFEGLAKFTVLATGVWLFYQKRHSVGELVMILSWSAQAFGAIRGVSRMHRKLVDSWVSIKSMFDMLSVEPDVRAVENPIQLDKLQGQIEFRNVSLSYPNTAGATHRSALRNVNFTINPGETVAFVGESGAGKSTVIHALLRAQDPQEGRILIDDEDLRLLDLKHFRESVGLVDQEVALFDASLRYNITFGLNGRSKAITDSDLDRIAKMSGIDRFFPRLEMGYDTVIGERGVRLSGGEKQRVGIARALIKNPGILIFDEATSNLDTVNESIIRQSMEEAAKGRTTIIIAHRLSTIRRVERIFVFSDGEVVGTGSHDILVKKCEPYQRLIHSQVF